MARNEAGLTRTLERIPQLRDEFWQNVSVPGPKNNLNKNLEYAGRVADYLEFAEVLTLNALRRKESCGWPLPRGEPDADGEALRDDDRFDVAAWEFRGVGKQPALHGRQPLAFDTVKPSQRSYKVSSSSCHFDVASQDGSKMFSGCLLLQEAGDWKLTRTTKCVFI